MDSAAWQPADDVWVFAYGSLMWRPEMPVAESRPALLYGWHRDFCLASVVHRGTPARPGLVLGLAPGGSCRGLALRVAANETAEVLARLDARELVTGVYIPKMLPVRTAQGIVRARSYVCDRGHRQFVGRIGLPEQARIILAASGQGGSNLDYLTKTLDALAALGIRDRRLLALARQCAIEQTKGKDKGEPS
ncbi:MAG: gamma-glutamylcyclotransferase [Alphaproteobacteria bacterium]|nr:MAG: gamma-glutamylcyclotransferase [Alphaproteobacteria bacterium]